MDDKFKVGDIARITGPRSDVFYSVGDVVEVFAINPNDHILHYKCSRCSDNKVQNVHEEQLELVERKPAVEYKVGDRVIIARKGHSDDLCWADEMDKYIGRIGFISSINKYNGNLFIDVDGSKWWYKPPWVEPITESPIRIAPLFSSALSSFFGFSKREDVSAPSLPLIEPHKLLTDIKLD